MSSLRMGLPLVGNPSLFKIFFSSETDFFESSIIHLFKNFGGGGATNFGSGGAGPGGGGTGGDGGDGGDGAGGAGDGGAGAGGGGTGDGALPLNFLLINSHI